MKIVCFKVAVISWLSFFLLVSYADGNHRHRHDGNVRISESIVDLAEKEEALARLHRKRIEQGG